MANQADNACDIWIAMIRAGWAVPRAYMLRWIARSASTEVGKELLSLLMEHGIEIGDQAAFATLYSKKFELLDYSLTLHTPNEDRWRWEMLNYAASLGSDGTKYVELLFRHGVDCINWRDPDKRESMPMHRDDRVPRRTPLHSAAQVGPPELVERLIKHGAEPFNDYFSMTALDLAKSEGKADVVAVF